MPATIQSIRSRGSYFTLERLEQRVLLAGDGSDVVQIFWPDHEGNVRASWMRAGEWIVAVNPTDGGARDAYRGRESPIEPWLSEALRPLAAMGITFTHYLGKDSEFEIQAPRAMPFEEVEAALQAIPGFRVVEPNSISGGSFGDSEGSNANPPGDDLADSGVGSGAAQAIFNADARFSGLFDQGGSILAARASAPASLIAALRFSGTSIDLGDDEDADPVFSFAATPAL